MVSLPVIGALVAGAIAAATIGGLIINNRAYDRGAEYARAKANAEIAVERKKLLDTIDRQEVTLREQMRKYESLPADELDCRLMRIREPNAPCPGR